MKLSKFLDNLSEDYHTFAIIFGLTLPSVFLVKDREDIARGTVKDYILQLKENPEQLKQLQVFQLNFLCRAAGLNRNCRKPQKIEEITQFLTQLVEDEKPAKKKTSASTVQIKVEDASAFSIGDRVWVKQHGKEFWWPGQLVPTNYAPKTKKDASFLCQFFGTEEFYEFNINKGNLKNCVKLHDGDHFKEQQGAGRKFDKAIKDAYGGKVTFLKNEDKEKITKATTAASNKKTATSNKVLTRPVKPIGYYIAYMNTKKSLVKKLFPEMSLTERNQFIKVMWDKEKPEVKQIFIQDYETKMKKYREEMEAFRAASAEATDEDTESNRVSNNNNRESAIKKLEQEIVGMDDIKAHLDEMHAIILESQNDRQNSHQNFNIVLKGNPGTGKTTVANLIGAALFEIGAVTENKTVVVDKAKLGATPTEATTNFNKALKEAEKGVLFIDEA
eukprot:GEZU01009370.1.p1 GENE.GEZU01009370.1~~GEZU01009370.1.p1  ORF type:complete len:445 (+),score=117.29 GEZU01009370.1:27-1361(+)